MSADFGLIGHPLGHSLSPFIHRRLFALRGIFAEYTLLDLPPEEFDSRLAKILPALRGANVTVPYKQRIIPLCDRLEGKAALYRTVNTLMIAHGQTVGYNTDADGFLKALQSAGLTLSGRVLIVGCGGVGTMFACEAAAAGCEVILTDAGAPQKAIELQNRLGELFPQSRCRVAEDPPREPVDLLINASPVGMYPHVDACPVSDEVIAQSKAVFDAVYNPQKTLLLQKAEAFGASGVGGMAMLVWQAAQAQTLWLNVRFSEEEIAALTRDCTEQVRTFSSGHTAP